MRVAKYTVGPTVALAILFAHSAFAGTYEIRVTRKESNIYSVDGKGIIIKTKYCYEYVYGSEAILRTSGRSGKLIFIEEDNSCDVEVVVGKVTLDQGNYSITVSQEDDEWYRVDGTEAYIQTSLCLNLALGQEALLKISIGGQGRLHFLDDDDSCTVEAVFSRSTFESVRGKPKMWERSKDDN